MTKQGDYTLTPLQPHIITHHRNRTPFILKSLTLIITLTILVLGINYYLISNCPKDVTQEPNAILTRNSPPNPITPHNNQQETERLTITVYYEVLCPDSKSFILNQLVPAQKKYGSHINIRYIPFGKATVVKGTDSSYQFSCQHGPEECHGNKLHSCVIESYNSNQSLTTSIIGCSMSKYNLWQSTINSLTMMTNECRTTFAPSDTSPLLCNNSSRLLAAHGHETLSLSPRITFIPTISIDGSLSNQRQILRDLDTVICESLKQRTQQITC